ncbi:MAG: phosphoribosylamine--glycine ligase [Candidatus Nanohalarchaeota archaeon]|nr:MAG: phosphoribosylamine--glycine ligase [Candidatus Nanohaloarchaeota archaeon]
MNILIVGSGAREHIIAEKIHESKREPVLFCCSGTINPGIEELCKKAVVLDTGNIDSIVEFAEQNDIEYCVIGPEAPICMGLADELEKIGITVIAPKKKAAIEGSKITTRDLFKKYSISGNIKYTSVNAMDELNDAKKFLEELKKENLGFVVKPDGLTGGKGVKVQGEHLRTIDDALDYCQEILQIKDALIIEEKLYGEEFSFQAFSDGKTLKFMPLVQDHKRAFDGDTGPNTGGMGSYSFVNHSLPFLTEEQIQESRQIMTETIDAIKEEYGILFKGILYGGFMVTKNGIKLLEYNTRFGDPEAMNVLSILKTDICDIFEAIKEEKLDELNVEFEQKATVCKYIVPKNYPDKSPSEEIRIMPFENAKLYYANVEKRDGKLMTLSSRALAFVSSDENIYTAERKTQEAMKSVVGNVRYRRDIATKELIEKRISHMDAIKNGKQ